MPNRNSPNNRPLPPARRRTPPLLQSPGWSDETRRGLERLIRRGTGRHLPVVFDFDNSIVCGDIGEATLAVLARDRTITPQNLAAISPKFNRPDGLAVELANCADATEYYERLLQPANGAGQDPAPLATGYVWAVEALAGLNVAIVTAAAAAAFALAQPGSECDIEVTPGRTAYPAPWFYPEMVELIATLLAHEFDLWVVSASNVWSVRWLVLNGLNPLLQASQKGAAVRADHVVGVSLLLRDERGSLLKDPLLVTADAPYARMERDAIRSLQLTLKLHFPVPVYSGKVAAILDLIGRRPFLAVGDSPGDHAMLTFSEHRLWIARLEKPDYLRATIRLMQRTGPANWLLQPTLCRTSPGFVPDLAGLAARPSPVPERVRASRQLLAGLARNNGAHPPAK